MLTQVCLGLVLAGGLAAGEFGESQEVGQEPNVLVVVADDLSAWDLRIYAGMNRDRPPTPNIDSLAADGVMFRNAWANPVCAPSRAVLQTGRYAFRHGVGWNPLPRLELPGLPLAETTIPEMLDEGTGGRYAHAAIGKWHMGSPLFDGPDAPNLAGYAHFAGTPRNIDDYFQWSKTTNGVAEEVDRYATSETVDDAIAWIESAPEPWFCYVAFHAPHYPYHEPPQALHTYDLDDFSTRREHFEAMVQAMDTELGRLLDGLGESRSRTQIVFVGDNGTDRPVRLPSVRGRQSKLHLLQGGVLVPLIVSGPDVVAAGREVSAPVGIVDVFATVADWAGVDLGAVAPIANGGVLDSESLVPYLKKPAYAGGRGFHFVEIFQRIGADSDFTSVAISDGAFKLIRAKNDPVRHPSPLELYDLRFDPLENFNLLNIGGLTPEGMLAFYRMRGWLQQNVAVR